MVQRPPLLYLTHRIPYPPNKGDKLRSFNILRQLASRYRVYLGTFVDQADDLRHVTTLQRWCEDVRAVRLYPRAARLLSLRGLLCDEALSLPYYRSAGLREWVARTVSGQAIDKAVAFSSPMAQYLDVPGLTRRVIDYCDLDSAKWTQYAADRRWPMSSLYRREGECLLRFEQKAAATADAVTFVTDAEAALFRKHAPTMSERVHTVQNGVDADYFSPHTVHTNPYPADDGPRVVFTGAMDYWPNVDAVCWFVQEILPSLRSRHPDVRFYIVGMNPSPTVRALECEHVCVTGSVDDIRPWLMHADVVAAPLRIARGIQNKVLEAMAMGRPVVVSRASATGLAAQDGVDFHAASSTAEFIAALDALLRQPELRAQTGASARECVLAAYSWTAHLRRLEALLTDTPLPLSGGEDLAFAGEAVS